jgi:hypothetical protein
MCETTHRNYGRIICGGDRRWAISIYLMASGRDRGKLLVTLGKHKMGKACLNIRRMSYGKPDVLERLIANAVAEARCQYG